MRRQQKGSDGDKKGWAATQRVECKGLGRCEGLGRRGQRTSQRTMPKAYTSESFELCVCVCVCVGVGGSLGFVLGVLRPKAATHTIMKIMLFLELKKR